MSSLPPDDRSGATRPSGQLLDGKYQLLRLLGKGGMGEVWEAEHAKLGRRVAVKFIHAEAAEDPGILARFQNEARTVARLRSRFIVQVLDDGVSDEGRPYIVMELLTGESLGDRLERTSHLPIDEVHHILRDVCRGLSVAHEAGIVHRDLKPDNIFLHRGPDDDAETAKLVDFGIAKFSEGGPGHSTTVTGSMLGTPLYMSPEQARGAKPIDLRSDVWSLGVVAAPYQCLTGDVPFRGSTMGDLSIHICLTDHDPPSSQREGLSRAIDSWMARVLAKDKTDRFASAAEMLAAFEASMKGAIHDAPRRASGRPADTALAETFDHSQAMRPRPVAPLPQVRAASDDTRGSGISAGSGEQRPPTFSPVSTRGGGRSPAGAPRAALFLVGLAVAFGGGALLLFSRSPTPAPSGSALAATADPPKAEPLREAQLPSRDEGNAPPATPPPASASPSAPLPGASSKTPPGAPRASARPRRKGPSGGGDDDLGY